MEPILCPSCGETVSDKYRLFKKEYSNPFNTSFEEVCKKLKIRKMCTKMIFLATCSKEQAVVIQNKNPQSVS